MPDLAEQIASVEARGRRLVVETIRRVGEQLGRPDPDPDGVRVEIGMRLGRRAHGGWSAARTSGWGDSVRIELSTEFFVGGTMDLDLTVRHEAVHAYLRRRLGRRLYRRIPPWFQEGIAIHLAGQSDAKIAEFVYNWVLKPQETLAGLEAPESFGQHGEYALALRFLETFSGGVDTTLKKILDGQEVYAAIESVSGLERHAFIRAARVDAELRLKAFMERLPEAYREGLARHRAMEFDLAMAAFERVFTEAGIELGSRVEPVELRNADPVAVWAVARWAGIAAKHSDRLTEAVAALRLLLSLPPHVRGQAAWRLRYWLAGTLRRQGLREDALAEYARVLRLHPESRWRPGATVGITYLLYELGRYEEALEWAAACDESEYPAILYVRGFALLHLGRRDAGLRVLRQFVERHEDHPRVEQVRKRIAKVESEPFPYHESGQGRG